MDCPKRYLEVDPDYELSENDIKRIKVKEADVVERVKDIINKEFKKDFDYRQNQLELIQRRITTVKKTMHVLRYALITAYYNNKSSFVNQSDETGTSDDATSVIDVQSRIHPAVKKLIGNNASYLFTNSRRNRQKQTKDPLNNVIQESSEKTLKIEDEFVNGEVKTEEITIVKEELLPQETNTDYVDIRNRKKIKRRIIVGNISKWMPSGNKEDNSTHKWMVYVRGTKESPEIAHFVEKVVFYLHPSYKPNDVIEIKKSPFHLSRRGWGEFPLRVQIFFHCNLNKPVDVIHNLKLDRTYTGRQTLGNETIADLHLYDDTSVTEPQNFQPSVKSEPLTDDIPSTSTFNSALEHDYCGPEIKSEKVEPESSFEMEIEEKSADMLVMLDHNYCLSNEEYGQTSFEPLNPINSSMLYGLTDDAEMIEEVISDFKTGRTNVLSEFHVEEAQTSKNLDAEKYKIQLPRNKFKNVHEALPYILRRLPLVTEKASDANYKCVHPYATNTEEEFLSWNIGKRLSCEWRRASTALNILNTSNVPGYENWNTKCVFMYARTHAYTPGFNHNSSKRNHELGDFILTYQPSDVLKKPFASSEPDVPINIVDTDHSEVSKSRYTDCGVRDENLSFVRRAALDCRVSFQAEEIAPGCYFNGAERTVWEAVKLFANDLVRNSQAHLLFNNGPKDDLSEIGVQDVLQALNKRKEFQTVLNLTKKATEMQYYW